MGRPRHRLRHGRRRLAVDRPGRHRGPLRRHDRLPGPEQPDRHRHRGHPQVLRRVPGRLEEVLRLPHRGRRQRLGLPHGHRREPRRDEGLRGQVRLRLLRPAQGLQGIRRHVGVLLPAGRQPAHVRRGRLHPEGLRRHHHGLPERPLHLRLRLELQLGRRRCAEQAGMRRGARSLQGHVRLRPARQHQQLLPRDERLLHQRAGCLRHELLRLPAGPGQPGHQPELLRQGRLLLEPEGPLRRSVSPRSAARAPASTATSTTPASRRPSTSSSGSPRTTSR